ncbi:hypothetical protein LEP1GSC047_4292 [Leptospira inadai serovar Lyme str. 10]|uniref:Uncharacterized protein n=2 Tax=Leptospira inadai serovar Lyme TaxID=293084 RepID=V6HY40_9LEPT|nr:hypothetical protein [Leptospira inadai]EQA37924.1 hypothetical protein LEP1GSC047_4292 [Leptospira inadai serovar Lyme str. 10]PNV71642.1 hypothetical protein BES34_021160 [Leptospira inadai serovar Lyme]
MKPKVITLAEYKEKKGLVDKPRKKLKKRIIHSNKNESECKELNRTNYFDLPFPLEEILKGIV